MNDSNFLGGRGGVDPKRRAALKSASTLVIMSVCSGGAALADCVPQPGNAKLIDCTGTDPNGYSDSSDDLTISVATGATVAGSISVDDRNALINGGTIASVVVDDFNVVTNNATVTNLIFIGNNNTVNNNGTITVSGTEGIFSSEQNNTVNNTGSISAAGASREAIQITGVNAIVTGSGSISTTGNTSEAIELGTGATVTYSGAISTTGTSSNAIAVGAGSTVTLQSGASVTTSGASAVGIYNLDDGVSVSVIANGASIVTSGANASGIIDADDANITLNGQIRTSGANAYAVDLDDDSIVTIGTTGSVITSGDGARGLVVGRRTSVTNAGSISATGASGDGVLFDEGVATLSNSGTISSAQAYGILLDDDEPGTASSITNLAGGSISGASGSIATAGIVEAEATQESIFNYGTLTGDVTLGAGTDLFALYNAGSVTGAISLGLGNDQFFFQNANLSAITGAIDGGAGFDRADGRFTADGIVDFSRTSNFEFYTVDASGADTDVTIAATSLVAPLALYGTASFINQANVSAADDTALSLVDHGARLVNRGTLSTVGAGAEALTAGNSATLVHEGSVLTAGADSEGIQVGNAANLTVTAAGAITTTGAGSEGIQAGDDAVLTVAGTITTSGDNSEAIQLDNRAALTINAGAVITTSGEGSEGIEVESGTAAAIAGRVETRGAFSSALRARGAATVNLASTGALRVSADDTVAVRLQQGGVLSNAGTIASTGGGNAAAVFLDAGAERIENTGTIASANDVAIFVSDSGSSPITLLNRAGGVISGPRGSIVSISLAATAIVNAGTLVGDVELFSGNDSFTHQSGGRFSGARIDMGDGDDRFVLEGGALSDLTGVILGGSGNDTFTYASGASDIAAASVFGFELLDQRSGRLTATDDLTFNSVEISGGTLYLSSGMRVLPNDFNNSAARAQVLIGAQGVLSGAGEVVGSVVNNGQIRVDPGATFRIAGDLSLNAGSLIALDVTGANVPGLQISGRTTLNGGTVRLSGTVLEDRTLLILQSAGGLLNVSGLSLQFDNNIPFTEISGLIVGDTSVAVRVDQKLIDPDLGTSASTVGRYVLDQLSDADNALLAALTIVSDSVTSSNLESTLLGLSPEIYASAPFAVSLENSRSLFTHLTEALSTDAEGPRVWGSISGAASEYESSGVQQGFDLTSTKTLAGADVEVSPGLRLGGLASFGETDTEFKSAGNTYAGTEFTFGGYGAYAAGDFSVNAAVTQASTSFEGTRSLANGAAGGRVDADFDTNTLGVHVGGLWHAPVEGWHIKTETAFDWMAIERDGFTEAGASPLALTVSEDNIDAALASAGISVAKPVNVGDLVISPRAAARFVHNFSDTEHTATGGFVGGNGQAFASGSVILPDDTFETALGLSIGGQAWTFGGDLEFAKGDAYQSLGGRLKASYRF